MYITSLFTSLLQIVGMSFPLNLVTLVHQSPMQAFSPAPYPEHRHAKHKFTPEEDERLTLIVKQFGESNWKMIAEQMGTRNCRQCRERWKNYLSPNVCKDPWTPQEDTLLQEKYKEYGSQWSLIAKFFPSRTDVNLKNRWVVLTNHTVQEKRVRRRGANRNANFGSEKKITQVKIPTVPVKVDTAVNTDETEKAISPPESCMDEADFQENPNLFHMELSLFNSNEEICNLFEEEGYDIFSF